MALVRRVKGLLLFLLLAPMVTAQQPLPTPSHQEKLGTVNFATTCNAAAQGQINRAVALLHSFQFGPATAGFQAALAGDPGCGIAYWGIALARWTNPFSASMRPVAQLQLGLDAVEQGKKVGAGSKRERAYLDAVGQLYANYATTDQRSRILSYEKAMAGVAAEYPDDKEATIFYALAMASAADPADKTYARQLKAGEILEKLFAEQPDHPGLAHYIIHAYDVPALAPRAIEAARRYSEIAPSAPHALHMPSHTFTRVGYWQDSINSNILAAAAARREGQTTEELHSMDYRMYAYLQSGQDTAARQLLDALPEVALRFSANQGPSSAANASAGYFAMAAIPARYALERGAWADAAKLPAQKSEYPHTVAITYFARGLGAARSGDANGARAAAKSLQQLHDRLLEAKEGYWALQVEIQRQDVEAWAALAEGHPEEALREMKAAAAMEDGTEKNAVTPGPIAPARELLGEMLLQLKHPDLALVEFESTLKKEPNRFRSLYGAAHAAQLAGNPGASLRYFGQLLKTCEHADQPPREELAEAQRAQAPLH